MKLLCFPLFVSLFFFFSSCTVEISNPLDNAYSGITETEPIDPMPTGVVDPDDWQKQDIELVPPSNGRRTVPFSFGFDPAFPNPTEDFITFQFVLGSPSSVIIFISDKPGSIIDTLLNKNNHPSGYYKIVYDARGLESGIYRVFLSGTAENGAKFFSYGDFRRK